MTPPQAVIIEALSLRLGKNSVLKEVSLSFPCRELVALVGPGSGGKTQLLKTIATLRKPTAGRMSLFGEVVDFRSNEQLNRVRARIGLQFQNFALFDSLSVGENVAFPMAQQESFSTQLIEERVVSALEDVELLDSRHKFPSELSGGMRRRVSIARVMALAPDLALFDDPVSGLDPVSSARIMALLGTFAQTRACLVIVASHDLPRLLPVATRVVAIFNGEIAFDGPTTTALASTQEPLASFLKAGMEHHGHPTATNTMGSPQQEAGHGR